MASNLIKEVLSVYTSLVIKSFMIKFFFATCCLITFVLITYFTVSPFQTCKRNIPDFETYKDAKFEDLIAREDLFTAQQLSLLYRATKRIVGTERQYTERTIASCMRTTSW